MSEAEVQIVGKAITEAVCKRFDEWWGAGIVSFNLKADIYAIIAKALTEGVEE